jgi:PPOX class probable F420-dependent enzyme
MKTYPQKPPMTDDERVAFLQKAPIARLGSINPDGTVHLAALWFTYDKTSGSLMFGTQDMTYKVRNIKRNPKVTVLIDIEGPPLKGVLMYGQAELDYRDVMSKRVAIFEKYMPRDDAIKFAEMMASSYTPVIIRVRPTRVSSYDYAKEGMLPLMHA